MHKKTIETNVTNKKQVSKSVIVNTHRQYFTLQCRIDKRNPKTIKIKRFM